MHQTEIPTEESKKVKKIKPIATVPPVPIPPPPDDLEVPGIPVPDILPEAEGREGTDTAGGGGEALIDGSEDAGEPEEGTDTGGGAFGDPD